MALPKSQLIQLGLGATAMTAIIGLIVMISPLLQSDVPPFAGVARVELVAQSAEQTQKLLDKTAETLRRVTEKQDQQDLDYWSGQLAIAEARLKLNPADELARGMLKVAQAQLSMINSRMASQSGAR